MYCRKESLCSYLRGLAVARELFQARHLRTEGTIIAANAAMTFCGFARCKRPSVLTALHLLSACKAFMCDAGWSGAWVNGPGHTRPDSRRADPFRLPCRQLLLLLLLLCRFLAQTLSP